MLSRAAAALLCALALASAAGAAAPSPGTALSAGSLPPPTTLGLSGWRVQSSAVVGQPGDRVSSLGFPVSSWLAVSPDDAGAPGTEIEALLQNGACPDVFFSTRMKQCFGYQAHVGAVMQARFAVPWWFRTEFSAPAGAVEKASLIVNGVVGAADVWLNGQAVATHATVTGAFTRYSFGVTALLRPHNVLALEVFANNPRRMYTLDNVDWTQVPPDNDTGIQFPVQLALVRGLGIDNAHVLQRDAPDLSSAALTVKADVSNPAGISRAGVVQATISPPAGAGPPAVVSQAVTLGPHSTQTVVFQPGQFPALLLHRPRTWWPYQLGPQPLYTLSTFVTTGGNRANASPLTFGIRTVSSFLTGASALAPHGVRVFAVNGRPLLIRAGGWSEDLFLHYSAADTATQVRLLKSAGLNAARLEGHEMPDDFYNQMDRAGVLIDAGYQCCDKWQPAGTGAGLTERDLDIMELSARTIGTQLRDHPSVVTFGWSDNAPVRDQEIVTLRGFAQADFEVPFVSSAEYRSSRLLGPSGEKEGPYDWVPPSYWYDTAHGNPGDSTLTNAGGSWGFDSEQSAGDSVPTLDSIRRFMSAREQTLLWTDPSFNQYHANYEPGHRGYAFGTLFNLDAAISARYGSWSSLAQYVEEAQLQNYEDTRAQFEAFIDHWTHRPTPATGTVYWQLNKGWPSLLWTLYNNDYDLAGSYFGAKKANETLHAFYAPDSGTVVVDNLGPATEAGISVTATVHSLDGALLDEQTASLPSLGSQVVASDVLHPRVPRATAPPAAAVAYFVEVTMQRRERVIDRNVYWLSTQPDVVDWPSTIGSPQAVMRQYADLRSLHRLMPATLAVTVAAGVTPGLTQVTITNTSAARAVALFIRADVWGAASTVGALGTGQAVLPITWSDNDISLWPGESQTLTASYDVALLDGLTPVVSVSAWNAPQMIVSAPLTVSRRCGCR